MTELSYDLQSAAACHCTPVLPDASGCDLALCKQDLIDLVLSPPHCAVFSILSRPPRLSLHAVLLSRGKTKWAFSCLAAQRSYNVLPLTESRCVVHAVSPRTKWNV